MNGERKTPKRLTDRVLDGLEDACGELEMQETCGWEGTPYECRRDDEDGHSEKTCEVCVARTRMEDAVMWLRSFIHKTRQKRKK